MFRTFLNDGVVVVKDKTASSNWRKNKSLKVNSENNTQAPYKANAFVLVENTMVCEQL